MFPLRIAWFGLSCLASFAIAMACSTASANNLLVPLDVSHPVLDTGTRTFVVLQDVPASWTVAQVAAEPANHFSVFDPKRIYRLDAQNALWLHFKVGGGATASQTGWTFELPKPFVDRVEFYSRDAAGGWQMQQAGDHVPQSQWAVRGLHPQFPLPILAPGTNDFYVKVQQYFPLRFSVDLKTTEAVIFKNQNTLLMNGFLIGLLVLMGLFAIAIAVLYKSAAYPWYALYIVFAILSNASYVGLGFFAFWPSLPKWAELSHCVLLVAAVAAQLQFCHALFVDETTPKWSRRLVTSGVVFLTLTALLSAWIPANVINWRINVTVFASLLAVTLILCIVVRKAYQRSLVAWICLLAYAPVIVVLGLTFIDQFGFAPLVWLPYNAIGFAVAFESLVLLIVLHLHVKSTHTSFVRKNTLADLDPLTGFLAALQYPDALAHLWSQTRSNRQDMAVAYVRATVAPDVFQAANQPTDDEMVLRCVRMLRMLTRQDDTVAHIGKNVFAVLMPGVSLGPNFSSKLSRLIAMGRLQDTDDSSQIPVQFQIAATTFRSYSSTSGQLNTALWKTLNEMILSTDGAIEFVAN